MELLDARVIRDEKKKNEMEANERVRKLADEETRLVTAVNDARLQGAKAMKEIQENHDAFVLEKKKERNALIAEVEGLYERRREELIPVDVLKKNAEKLLATNEARAKELDGIAEALDAQHEKNQDEADSIDEIKDELKQQSKDLDKRERQIVAEENRQKASSLKLGDRWAGLTEAIHAANQDATKAMHYFDTREAKNAMIEAAQKIRHEEQDKRDKELENKDIALADKYRSLQAATNEVYKKHGIKV